MFLIKSFEEAPMQEEKIMELRLRALHDLLPETYNSPKLTRRYYSFLKTLQKRLHPTGKKDVRIVKIDPGFEFQIDISDRLGCDFYYGYYQELLDSRLFLEMISAGSTVVDVGANFGYYTVMARGKTGPSGVVHAFEPNKDAYELLNTNVTMNKFNKEVFCSNICIGDKDGEIDFHIYEESSFSCINETKRSPLREKTKIPMHSLDTLCQELGSPKVDAIKIDVEGFEYAVLLGALETIKRSPNIVIMMEISSKNLNKQTCSELITSLDTIYKLGLQGWIIGHNSERLCLLEKPEDAALLKSASLFLAFSGSEREQQLHQTYNNLLHSCDIAKQSMLPIEPLPIESLIKINNTNVHNWTNYDALIATIVSQYDDITNLYESQKERAEKFKIKIQERDEKIQEMEEQLKQPRQQAEILFEKKLKQAEILFNKKIKEKDKKLENLYCQVQQQRERADKMKLKLKNNGKK